MTRLFIAIDLPEKVKTNLFAQLDYLRNLYPQFSWVQKENYHITIYFFGDIEKTKNVVKKLDSLLYAQPKLFLYSLNLDLFVNRKKIVIYQNFRREKNLEKLAALIEEGFINSQTPKQNEQKFVPHLTLARYKLPSKQQYFALKTRLAKTQTDFEFIAPKIILFESVLGGKKPVYKKIAQWKLG